ncbi:MAG: class I SAM-dependent methyltransferase [Cyclobacteriaceae bacterium]|nr:class I SAM-dependent methyltransferase [Cyclobacteriaceae bacterium]
MDKSQHRLLRADLFRHLDGIVTAPTAFALWDGQILDCLKEHPKTTLQEVSEHFNANEGYLNVAMRMLASQGWLQYRIESDEQIVLELNENSLTSFELIPIFKDVVDLMSLSGRYHPRKFEKEPFVQLENIYLKYRDRYGLAPSQDPAITGLQEQVLKHIEGIIVGPTVVALGMSGMFHKYFMEASFKPEEFHQDAESFERLLDIFCYLDWFSKKNGTYTFTEKGLFYAKRASAYGVTVSYIPTFRKVSELIFGDPTVLWSQKNAPEIHVDREMNVWGSGGAHATYFRKIDEIIIDIFNQPIENQPKGIVDMGCGNGAFIEHLFDVIDNRTLRGTLLNEHPLFLVGADYNQAALKVTKENLIQADIWAKVIWGDIGRPDLLARDLQEGYGIDLQDLLNVRTFLDHNRIWKEPASTSSSPSESTGAFAFRGRRLPNALVEQNLQEHLNSWAPYVKRFGLLVIELHTIAPYLTAANLGKTAATAYDATHGFSDQYIVEIEVFNKVAALAGLAPVNQHFTKYPDSELATVSINLLQEG